MNGLRKPKKNTLFSLEMYRRVGWTIINLKHVSMIRAVGNKIKYTLSTQRGTVLFGSGGLESEEVTETYATYEECGKAFNELANSLIKKEEMK